MLLSKVAKLKRTDIETANNERVLARLRGNRLALGSVVDVTPDGEVLIACTDWELKRSPAKIAQQVSRDLHIKAGDPVLIAWCENDGILVIVDKVVDRLKPSRATGEPEDSLVFESGRELTLKCGDATIMLKKDGRVIVRGRKIVSRASHANKMKGATISLN